MSAQYLLRSIQNLEEKIAKLSNLSSYSTDNNNVLSGDDNSLKLNSRLDALEAKPDLTPRVDALEAKPDLVPRVNALEAKPDLTPRVDALEAKPDLAPRVNALEAKPDLAPRVDALETKPDLSSKIEKLESNYNNLANAVKDINDKLNSLIALAKSSN